MSETKSQEAVTRLKELLFDRESREIDTLQSRLIEVQKRAGSDEQFQRTVARVLEGALREAEAARHRELSDAMSPMVVRTLRAEMQSPEMQDKIAGSMYPRIGEMVSRYVSSAIRDMMQEINRRLESGLSHNRLVLWIRSKTSGRSMAELALADTQRLEVEEIYLVRRGAGTLVHRWRRPGSVDAAAGGGNRDALVSGFLAAITSFAEEAFEADREGLRTLDLHDHRIYLRGSPDYLLAINCVGSAPAGIDRILDAELIRVLADHQDIVEYAGGSPDEAAAAQRRNALLTGSAERIESTVRARIAEVSRGHGMSTLKALATTIAVPLLAFAAWYGYVGFVTRNLQGQVNGVLATIPGLKGYPVKASVERGGHRIWVTGLAPDAGTRRLVFARLKEIAPQAEVSETVGVLPTSDVEARLAAENLKRAVERAIAKLRPAAADLAAVRERISALAEKDRIVETERATTAAIAQLEKGGLEGPGGRPDDRLTAVIATFRAATDRLAAHVGGDPVVLPLVSKDAPEGVEMLSVLADRIGKLIVLLEQRRSIEPVRKQIDQVSSSINERAAELERRYRARIEELERRLGSLSPSTPSARQRLESFIRTHAVFFGNDADYRTPEVTAVVLTELASLIKEAGVGVRVVGYTDEAGGLIRNSPLSQARADKVMAELVARGAPKELLVAVGRLNGSNLAPGTGIDSPNRRVEFEISFAEEKGGRR